MEREKYDHLFRLVSELAAYQKKEGDKLPSDGSGEFLNEAVHNLVFGPEGWKKFAGETGKAEGDEGRYINATSLLILLEIWNLIDNEIDIKTLLKLTCQKENFIVAMQNGLMATRFNIENLDPDQDHYDIYIQTYQDMYDVHKARILKEYGIHVTDSKNKMKLTADAARLTAEKWSARKPWSEPCHESEEAPAAPAAARVEPDPDAWTRRAGTAAVDALAGSTPYHAWVGGSKRKSRKYTKRKSRKNTKRKSRKNTKRKSSKNTKRKSRKNVHIKKKHKSLRQHTKKKY